MRVRFNHGKLSAKGFEGKDHYHICNPVQKRVDFAEILKIGLIDLEEIKIVLKSNDDVIVLIVNTKEVDLIKDNK